MGRSPRAVRGRLVTCGLVGLSMVFSGALFRTPDASGDELQWRPPKVRAATPKRAAQNEAKASSQRPRQGDPANVLRTSHVEATEGPNLAAATGKDKEPRKLKSVVVKRSVNPRPIAEAQPAGDDRDAAHRDQNVLRATQEEGPAQWRQQGAASPTSQLESDPFESGPMAGVADAGAAHDRGPAPLRLAQSETSGRRMRSVLTSDPFDAASASQTPGSGAAPGRLISQPAEPAQLEPADEPGTFGQAFDAAESGAAAEEGGQPEPGIQPEPREEVQQDPQLDEFAPIAPPRDEAYVRDRTLETEREEAARVCSQALEVIQSDRINTIKLGINVEGTVGDDIPFECELDAGEYEPRDWQDLTFMWKASALCHKPLYFEDVHLERYGHSWGWHLQPLVSGAHFFTTLPILPYKMGLETPNECIYALGYYRPGNCAPYLIEPLGTSPRAVVWQAGAVVGFSALVP